MGNIIFYFTGTGNSLKIARTVSNGIDKCEIIPMGANQGIRINKEYDSIGFIYPIYFWGLPKSVKNFVSTMKIENNGNAYFYAIATYGGLAGNGIKLLNKLLSEKNVKLNYGKVLKIFSNYIVNFKMPNDATKALKKSDEKLIKIIDSIKNRETIPIGKPIKLFDRFYDATMEHISSRDNDFNIDSNCTGCGICKEVCPVNNIEITEKKPEFKHTCEHCMACIHYCPKVAINYKNKTQNKKRYTNPEISFTELARMNKVRYTPL